MSVVLHALFGTKVREATNQRTKPKISQLPFKGDEFEGVVSGASDSLVLLEGCMKWSGGDEYRGSFQNGLMHGSGSYFYLDGRVFVGSFVLGKKEGDGVLTLAEGGRMRGFFKSDLLHGNGARLIDGVEHIGAFEFGQPCGWGTRTYSAAGGSQHLGLWRTVGEREVLEGKTVYVQTDGSRLLEVYRSGKLMSSHALKRNIATSSSDGAPKTWKRDSEATSCFVCDTAFSLTLRRAHCRHCGELMCADCTKRTKVPPQDKDVKVCDDCFIVLKAKSTAVI
jgi:hypothetical protein